MNKYLEKIAANYLVEIPTSNWSPLINASKLSLDKNEYESFNRDVNKNWTGKRQLGFGVANGVVGAGYGALLGALVANLIEGPQSTMKGAKLGGSLGGALGAVYGVKGSHDFTKAESLKKYFPELNNSREDM